MFFCSFSFSKAHQNRITCCRSHARAEESRNDAQRKPLEPLIPGLYGTIPTRTLYNMSTPSGLTSTATWLPPDSTASTYLPSFGKSSSYGPSLTHSTAFTGTDQTAMFSVISPKLQLRRGERLIPKWVTRHLFYHENL